MHTSVYTYLSSSEGKLKGQGRKGGGRRKGEGREGEWGREEEGRRKGGRVIHANELICGVHVSAAKLTTNPHCLCLMQLLKFHH